MTQFKRINTLQINNHLWVFTDPQIIEWERDENSVTMHAVLRIHHEEHLTKDAPDLGESSASDDESNPAPKRVI